MQIFLLGGLRSWQWSLVSSTFFSSQRASNVRSPPPCSMFFRAEQLSGPYPPLSFQCDIQVGQGSHEVCPSTFLPQVPPLRCTSNGEIFSSPPKRPPPFKSNLPLLLSVLLFSLSLWRSRASRLIGVAFKMTRFVYGAPFFRGLTQAPPFYRVLCAPPIDTAAGLPSGNSTFPFESISFRVPIVEKWLALRLPLPPG